MKFETVDISKNQDALELKAWFNLLAMHNLLLNLDEMEHVLKPKKISRTLLSTFADKQIIPSEKNASRKESSFKITGVQRAYLAVDQIEPYKLQAKSVSIPWRDLSSDMAMIVRQTGDRMFIEPEGIKVMTLLTILLGTK